MNLDNKLIPAGDITTGSASSNLTSTVVICTRNRPANLKPCLEAVGRLSPPPTSVLVIDNSAGDAETEAIARNAGARYCVESALGLSRARNRGLRECSTDIVAFLDDDAIPDPDWLGLLVAAFADPRLAIAAGKVITPETNPDDATDNKLRRLSSETPQWFEIATFGGLGVGCNMALRRAACDSNVLFDERLGRGAPLHIAEEHYAIAYLISNGFAAEYRPEAVVHHPEHSRLPVLIEARHAFAYWLLLLAEFPKQRKSMLSFLYRRLRHKPLGWPRQSSEPGAIVTSNWRVKLSAAFSGAMLFFTTPKHRGSSLKH